MPDNKEQTPEIVQMADYSQGSKYIPPEKAIGERIKESRKKLGLTVEQLSDLTSRFDHEENYADGSGVSTPSLYRYEKGDRMPGARELRLLCEALKVSPNWLLLGEKQDKEESEYGEIGKLFCSLVNRAEQANRPKGSSSNDLLHALKLSETKSKST